MKRALVLGAGIGGLCAAAALRFAADEVLVLERDQIPVSPVVRRGVPQSTQLHNLLTAAQVHLEELLPGFLASIAEAGAVTASVSADTYVYELGTRMPERDLHLALLCARRPVIEKVARDLLLQDDRVRILERVSAIGLRVDDDVVRGVSIRSIDSPQPKAIDADLVVDAMGSGSNMRRWLEGLGHGVPEEVRRVDQWYASALYRLPAAMHGSNRFWLIFPTMPRSRAGLASPVDGDHVCVSLSGRADDPPPGNHDEYLAYARTLEDPSLGALVAESEPASPVSLFHKKLTTWRHYEHMESPISGLLYIGDSFASLNPLFGQGISVAAWQGAVLARHLRKIGAVDRDALTDNYISDAAAAIRAAWDLGGLIDPDERWQRYLRDPMHAKALAQLLFEDESLHRTYVGIWHLVEPARSLDSPSIVSRVREKMSAIASAEENRAS